MNKTPRQSGRRVWAERIVFLAVIIAIGIWAGLSRLTSAPYTIVVSGKPLVTVESRSAARKVLEAARSRNARHFPSGSVRFTETVAIRKAAREAEIADIPEAVRVVEQTVPIEVEAFAIVVNDEAVVAFRTEEDADETLRLLKRHYTRGTKSLYAQPTFKEEVYVQEQFVPAEKLCDSPSEGVRILTSVSEEPQVHLVERGDRAVHIARKYGVSIDELEKLNPGTDLNRLVEGDRLIIRKARLPITVISKALVTKVVTVTPPPDARRYGTKSGKRQMRILVTYENGEQVSEEIISQVTTWDRPQPRSSRGVRSSSGR